MVQHVHLNTQTMDWKNLPKHTMLKIQQWLHNFEVPFHTFLLHQNLTHTRNNNWILQQCEKTKHLLHRKHNLFYAIFEQIKDRYTGFLDFPINVDTRRIVIYTHNHGVTSIPTFLNASLGILLISFSVITAVRFISSIIRS